MQQGTCPACGCRGGFRHMHETAHGIEGTHMAGSERFECEECDHSIHVHGKGAEQFKFILDVKR